MRVATWSADDGMRLVASPDAEAGPDAVWLTVEAAFAGESLADALPRRGDDGPLGRRAVGWLETDEEHSRRVLVPSRVACGRCPLCERGHDAQCPAPLGVQGTLADRVLLPKALVRRGLTDVPENLPAEAALLAEDLGLVLKVRDRLAIRPQERAVVFGVGRIGLLATRVLSLTDVEVVYVEMGDHLFDLARELGAAATLTVDELKTSGLTPPVDLVVQTSALAHDEALACLPPGGRMAFLGEGVGRTDVAVGVGRLQVEEHWIVGSSYPTDYHLGEAMRAMAGGLLDIPRLVETIPLDEVPIRLDAPSAVQTLGPRPVVVRP